MRAAAKFLIVAMIAHSATPAVSAPLCRDGKGLFTPCVGEHVPRARHDAGEAGSSAMPQSRPSPDRPRKPPVVARSRLCRDSKGLFTPCPR